MRIQYCREHIDKAAEGCDLDRKMVAEIKRAAVFAEEHGAIASCATTAIIALDEIPDPEVKDLTISHVETLLKEKTPTGGTKWGGFTANQMKAFRARFELQVSNARQKEATRLRKEAEKKYAEVKEIADAEEKKRKDAEFLGVVLKIADPELEKIKVSAMEKLAGLKEILGYQTARRREQEKRLKEVEEEYATRLERVGVCREGLKKAEREAREKLDYRNAIMKEIGIIDENSRITSEKIAEQVKLLV